MGYKLIDLTGKRFGKLVVLKRAYTNKNKQVLWECQCDCGKKSTVLGQSLRRNRTKSCGCSQAPKTHGMYHSKEYKVWDAMIQRCTNPNQKKYSDYGGRGITVCDEWRDFKNFYKDMGRAKGLTLDRKDNDKGYSKDNCRWATRKKQANNTRTNAMITLDGITRNRGEWSDISGIPNDVIRYRISKGWDIREAIYSPVTTRETSKKFTKKVMQMTKDGDVVAEYDSITEAYKATGISRTSIGYCCNMSRKTAGGFTWKFI